MTTSTSLYHNENFYRAILDSVQEHLVVIKSNGDIVYTNLAWNEFAKNNNYNDYSDWLNTNYLEVCDKSASKGDVFGLNAANGIRQVVDKTRNAFYFEYPCHSPDKQRWFLMVATPLRIEDEALYVISHIDITTRKLAEQKAEKLSRIDSLTNIPNRRQFVDFLKNELLRCRRSRTPVSLISIDIDHFKEINDTYGHFEGDSCLKKISKIINSFAQRPTDLAARVGGEEFALVLGNTDREAALELTNNLIEAIRDLKIPNKYSSVSPFLTISAGLVSTESAKYDIEELLKQADKLLYEAKERGKNQVISAQFD